jgi:hypothetical protein
MAIYGQHKYKVFLYSVAYAFILVYEVVAETCKGFILYSHIKLTALDGTY